MVITKRHRKKKPRLSVSEPVGIDIISHLHGSVLSNIFSRLSTKDVVRTSVLSKDWKRKWITIDKVDVFIDNWILYRGGLNLPNFLDEVLISHDHLRSFRATFWHMTSPRVQKWINAALKHNLEFLDVEAGNKDIIINSSLLNHTSLREVNVALEPSGVVIVDETTCSPKLTSLSLRKVTFVNQNLDSSTVAFEFPVLETLEFRGILFWYKTSKTVKYVEINAPSLTSLSYEPSWCYRDLGCDYSVKIVAPRLTRFFCDGIPESLILDGSSIVCAFLYGSFGQPYVHHNGPQATNLVNGFTNLEELTLSNSMAEMLTIGPPVQLHCHAKLTRLTLLRRSEANQLFKLLQAMPSLKFLSINVDEWEDYNYDAMEIVPSCIASSLEELLLQLFTGKVPQYNLAKFLLKTSKELKKFTITKRRVGLSKQMKKRFLSALGDRSPCPEICSRLPDIEKSSFYGPRVREA